jgi:hypothetical protein
VANIAVVKPDKAEKLEMILIQVIWLNFPDLYVECLKRSILRKSFRKVDDWSFRISQWERSKGGNDYSGNINQSEEEYLSNI